MMGDGWFPSLTRRAASRRTSGGFFALDGLAGEHRQDLIHGEEGGADGAHEVRVGADVEPGAELFLEARTMPMLRATPPVKVTSSSTPTRRTRPMVRAAMAWWTPARMSSTFLRWAR